MDDAEEIELREAALMWEEKWQDTEAARANLEATLQDTEMRKCMAVCLMECTQRDCTVEKEKAADWKNKWEAAQAEVAVLRAKPSVVKPQEEALASYQGQLLQYQQAHSQLTLQLRSLQGEVVKWRQWRHQHQAHLQAYQIPFPSIGPPYE